MRAFGHNLRSWLPQRRGTTASRKTRKPPRHRRLTAELLEPRTLLAITASVSYAFDTNNFFNTTAKQDVFESAVDSVLSRLQDDLNSIVPGGSNTWTATFFHPGTGSVQNVTDPTIAADTIQIYAGGRELGSTFGQGGPGGFGASGSASFINNVQSRGEPNTTGSGATDYGPWGGSITFDLTTNWHFGETTSGLGGTEVDFYSVVQHELLHLLGVGTADSWDAQVVTATDVFTGTNAVTEYDLTGDVPLTTGNGHFAEGTMDNGHEAAMDPSLLSGTRKLLTNLDLASLQDIGWQLELEEPPPTQQKLTANDAALADWFGYDVDIDGDIAVVGAKLTDDNGSTSGSVYIYQNVGGFWNQVKEITASDAQSGDQFGHAVSISGDTVVVGSWLEDTNGHNAGAAYVFGRDQGGTDNWGQIKKITGSSTTAGDKFGWSVDLSGPTLVVSANEDDPVGSASGAVFVFYQNEGGTNNWGEVKKLVASDAAAFDKFGQAVATDGTSLIVGAYLDDPAGLNSGSAYVFSRNVGGTDNWGQVKKIVPGDLAANDLFGYAVDVQGDRIVIGNWLDDYDLGPFKSNAGSIYVFERNEGGTNNWGQVTKSFADDPGPGDRVGASVALDGDVIVAGAQLDDAAFTDSGSAYAFQRDEGGADNWGQVEKLLPDDEHTNDNYGISIALDGDTVIVGSYVGDAGVPNSGVAYVHTLAGLGPMSFAFGDFDTNSSSEPAQESNARENKFRPSAIHTDLTHGVEQFMHELGTIVKHRRDPVLADVDSLVAGFAESLERFQLAVDDAFGDFETWTAEDLLA